MTAQDSLVEKARAFCKTQGPILILSSKAAESSSIFYEIWTQQCVVAYGVGSSLHRNGIRFREVLASEMNNTVITKMILQWMWVIPAFIPSQALMLADKNLLGVELLHSLIAQKEVRTVAARA